jgi:hypothetical protein
MGIVSHMTICLCTSVMCSYYLLTHLLDIMCMSIDCSPRELMIRGLLETNRPLNSYDDIVSDLVLVKVIASIRIKLLSVTSGTLMKSVRKTLSFCLYKLLS